MTEGFDDRAHSSVDRIRRFGCKDTYGFPRLPFLLERSKKKRCDRGSIPREPVYFMKEKEIIGAIREAEEKHGVKVVWAIESGSRAWEFSSGDSDFDVRCMHIGKLKDYLGIFQMP